MSHFVLGVGIIAVCVFVLAMYRLTMIRIETCDHQMHKNAEEIAEMKQRILEMGCPYKVEGGPLPTEKTCGRLGPPEGK